MATIQYARLYPDALQLQAKDGHNLTAGWVEIYLAGTDDPAVTYSDFNGTVNPQKIIVDDNGRFTAIVDKSKAYRVEVYDSESMLLWTAEPVWCTGNAGAGMSVTRVISTDGSIAVEENIAGSERTYDLSIAPSDSDDYLEWIKCSEEDCGSTWYPVYQAGTMETEAGAGIKVHAGQLYHFTNTFYVDPNGSGVNYDTFKVTMYCNDEIVDARDFDIDSSLNDVVMCEFSTDLIPEEDGVVYYKLTIPSTCEVSAEVQCHRIYSGINAVPDSCAAKPWVSEYFEEKSSMSAYIPYSGLEYNPVGNITGISGSAIYAALDSGTVSAIASSYAESAISSISGWSADFSSISSKLDASASSMFQPSGDYQTAGDYAYNSAVSSKVDQSAFNQCCDEVRSALDEKLDKSASSEFQPSGEYVYESAYSSFSSEVTNNISSISSTVSGLTGQYIEQSASSMFQPSGNYASASDLSAYVPFSGLEGEGGKVTGISGSAFKGHEYTGISPVTVDNTADTISVEHRTLCVDSTMTAYNSGASAVIGVNSAYVEGQVSGKQDTLTFSYDDDKISAINGSALAGQGGGGGLVTAIGTSESGITSLNNSGLVDTAALRSADYSSLYVQEPLYISASGDSSYIGISGDVGGIDSATCSAIASAYAKSAASSKLDTTAQVVTSTATQLYAGTTYVTSVNGTPISAARAGNAANASLANSAWYDGTGRLISALPDEATVSGIASSYVESGVSSKQDTLSFAYNTADQISSINGSALAGQGGGASVVVTGTAWDPDTSSYVYSTTSNLSAAERNVWTWQNGNKSDYISKFKDDSGNTFMAMASFLEVGAEQMYNGGIYGNGRLQFSPMISMFSKDHSNVYGLSPLTYATGASMNLSADYFRASYRGDTIFISRGPSGTIDSSNSSQIQAVRIEANNSRGSNISAYDATKTGYYGTTAMKLGRSGVFVDDSGNSSNTAASAELTTGSLTFYSAGSSDTMSQSSIPYWNGKADGSALTSYALSADVSGTVDLVSTQSANWGGSALQLSAGAGISLTLSGNVLIIATAEA